MPIANSIASFIIAILSGLGVGSGGLLVVYLSATGQMNVFEARSLNLLFFLLSAGSASLLNIKTRKFNKTLIFISSAFAVVGCIIGAVASNFVPANSVGKFFGWFLILSGIYTLISSKKQPLQKKP